MGKSEFLYLTSFLLALLIIIILRIWLISITHTENGTWDSYIHIHVLVEVVFKNILQKYFILFYKNVRKVLHYFNILNQKII